MFHICILIIASIINLSLSFIFSLIETSLIITDDVKLKILINRCQSHDKKTAQDLKKILENRDGHGAALSVAITLTNVTGSSILGSMASKYLPSAYVIVFTIMITYFMLIFARTVPKIYARSINEKVIQQFSWIIRGIYIITYPILSLTLIWLRILGLRKNKKTLSISELKDIISVYKESGIIGVHESRILDTVFSVKNKMIDNFINKDKEIFTLDANMPVEGYKSIIKKYKRKKFFVENEGHIIGVAFHRELLTALLDKKDSLIFQYTKKAILVSTNTTLVDVIVSMEKEKYSQAIILDGQEEPIGILSKKDIYLLLTKRNKPLSK